MPTMTTPDDGCRIYYETHGFGTERPVLVFINGTAQTTLNWLPAAKRLKSRFQVLLYDSRGQGGSDAPQAPFGIETHGRDLVFLLDQLKIQDARLAGLSHGGRIAVEVAGKYPEKIAKIMCLSTSMSASPRREALVASWLEVLRRGGVAALGWAMVPFVFGEGFLKRNHRYLAAAVQALAERNRLEAIGAYLLSMAADSRNPPDAPLRCPSFFVSGADDPIAPVSRVAETAKACGGVHHVIPDVGHSIPVEAPAVFDECVNLFLI